MPPKRKNKAATKPVRATSQPKSQPPVGAIRTSSIKRRRSSVPGKTSTSRLQPSEPLHILTRAAASKNTSPAAPMTLVDEEDLNVLADSQDELFASENERPAKRSRVSTDSGSPPNQMGSSVSQLNAVETDADATSQAVSNSFDSIPKRRRASDGSAATSKTATPNGIVHSESDVSEKPPHNKKRKTTESQPDSADAPPELTDSSTPEGSPEPILEVANSQSLKNVLPPTVNGEKPAKAGRRLPGRRRQAHSNINVEYNLRRQLSLKMNYRAIAKIQKGILEELAKRSLHNLESDAEFHKQCPDYEVVMAQLDQKFQNRMAQVEAERKQKLDQLERVRVAEKRIQEEQYINRFREFQDNYTLQCLYRMKQLERQMRAEQSGYATDDEEHIVSPTHPQFPLHDADDRLGSRYASRSRAYVETERLLEGEDRRAEFDQLRKAFLAQNPECDESVEEIPEDFAQFTGPDRAEALAHYNVDSLVEAAAEVERTIPQIEPPKVIPNEEADALFMLASVAARPPEGPPESQYSDSIVPSTVPSAIQSAVPSRIQSTVPSRVCTPAQQIEPTTQVSPFAPLSATSEAMSLETPASTPDNSADAHEAAAPTSPQHDTNGVVANQVVVGSRNETPARVCTHRVMDMLNAEPDVQPEVRDPQDIKLTTPEQLRHASPFLPRSVRNERETPQHDDNSVDMEDAYSPPEVVEPVKLSPRSESSKEQETRSSKSPDQGTQYWSKENVTKPVETVGSKDTRHPLERLKAMLERKRLQDEANGVSPKEPLAQTKTEPSPHTHEQSSVQTHMEPPPHTKDETFSQAKADRSIQTTPEPHPQAPYQPAGFIKTEPVRHPQAHHWTGKEAESSTRSRIDGSTERHESVDRHQMAPPLTRPYSPQDHPSTADRPGRSSTEQESGANSAQAHSASPSIARFPSPSASEYMPRMASPSARSMSYEQSSNDRDPAPYARSYDQPGRSYWDGDRRMSGSEGPSAQPEGSRDYRYGRTGRTPPEPRHESPYPPHRGSHLPGGPGQSSLPPKPPGQPPLNFRFAHYDPILNAPRGPGGQNRAPSVSYPPGPPPPRPGHLHFENNNTYRPGSYSTLPQSAPPPSPPPPLLYAVTPQPPHNQGYVPPPGSFQAPPPRQPAAMASQYPPVKYYRDANGHLAPQQGAHGQSHYNQPPVHGHHHQYPPQRPPYEHSHSSSAPPPQDRRGSSDHRRERRAYRSYAPAGTEFRPYAGPGHSHRGSRRG